MWNLDRSNRASELSPNMLSGLIWVKNAMLHDRGTLKSSSIGLFHEKYVGSWPSQKTWDLVIVIVAISAQIMYLILAVSS